ncbi:GNAT family N-acetyltransferase [Ruegeria arenilitoris]|uniref:GNAT family N-acetyltransferase n=1 Tax=Ruegeria arenilitoris TaxID=1173585 RepID=UPI00147DA4B5|nr:GNAT family N-acetyltransferase [Ruegeria arenilitoris]
MTPQELAHTHTAAFTQSRPWTESEFSDLLTNRFTHVIGNADCFALFQVIAGEAELLTIATHPNRQRQGLALRLMQDWHAKAKALGATRAFLDVAADNHPAIALYQRCGYTTCGLRKGYYLREKAEKIDSVVMVCALT